MTSIDYSTVFYGFVWAFLLAQGLRYRSFDRYSLFYLYVVVEAVSHFSRLTGIGSWSVQDPRYVSLYFGTGLVIRVTAIALLLWIYSLPKSLSLKWDWPIVVWLLSIAALELALTPGEHFLWRVDHFCLLFQAYLGIRTILRFYRLGYSPGWNVGAMLAALFFPVIVETVNVALVLSDLTFWSYEAFASLLDFINISAWGVIAWGMWTYDPPPKARILAAPEEREARSSRYPSLLWRFPR